MDSTPFDWEDSGDAPPGSDIDSCIACDMPSHLDDLGLCVDCAGKIERDLIRARDWDYTMAAFGLDDKERERLRAEVIRKYGAANELIVDKIGKKRKKGTKKKRLK